jgi:hypothetical protein
MSRATRRARNGTKYLPARWMDVSADAATAHGFAHTAMTTHHYTQRGTVINGVAVYLYGTLLREFIFDALAVGLILRLMGRPDGFARIVVLTEPLENGTRVTVSLLDGVFHADHVRLTIEALIARFEERGMLRGTSEPFSGLDLPANSPGQPRPNRKQNDAV